MEFTHLNSSFPLTTWDGGSFISVSIPAAIGFSILWIHHGSKKYLKHLGGFQSHGCKENPHPHNSPSDPSFAGWLAKQMGKR